MRNLAARLIDHEAGLRPTATGTPAAFAVSERMRTHLTTLMGNGGHRALLMRALAIAGAEVSWLCDIRINAEGALDGPAPDGEAVDPDAVREGGVVLIAQLLGLLVAFIGERLTLQLVREIWSDLPGGDSNFKI